MESEFTKILPSSQYYNFVNQCPAIVYLERTDVKETLKFTDLTYELDESILSRDTSISM